MGIGNILLCMKIMKGTGCLLGMCHGSKHLYTSIDRSHHIYAIFFIFFCILLDK